MVAFIYAELGNEINYSYQKPLLAQIKKQFPSVEYLDLDTYSDEFLITQACQMVEQANSCGIYFKILDSEAALGAILRLAEVVIRRTQNGLVVLQGSHSRLERLFSHRPTLIFLKNPNEHSLLEQLGNFYL